MASGYDSANQTAYLDDMLRWSLDWLMKVRQIPPSPRNTLIATFVNRPIHHQIHCMFKWAMPISTMLTGAGTKAYLSHGPHILSTLPGNAAAFVNSKPSL